MRDAGADDLRVHDIAMLGRLPHQRWLAAPSAADHAAVERALRETQAWDWRDRPLGELSGGGDAHAVEMAVTRLRAALGAPVVETVVKRGYRLAV